MTSAQRKQFWQDHVMAWQRSGLVQRAYCEQHGISLSTFGYWRKRLRQSGSKLIPLSPLPSRAAVVLSAAGVRMEVPAELLGEVLPLLWRSLREFA